MMSRWFKRKRRKLSYDRRKIVWLRDGGRCRYCDKPLSYREMEVDHITPIFLGGNDYIFNLACACRPCNREKSYYNWDSKLKKLPFWRRVYEIMLILWYWDLPEVKDFI
ncbi:MAG: hypothetical protein CSB13_06620 [Chloroflexi bacterium]|nr:MAG: hypothetical protein CSB13_06620 [Chloroflexota bacterium]